MAHYSALRALAAAPAALESEARRKLEMVGEALSPSFAAHEIATAPGG
jgi:hypothetical protein